MKKIFLGIGIAIFLSVMLILLTGCGSKNSKESEYIKEIKDMHFECDGIWYDSYKSITDNYTVSELMESQLEGAVWSEETVNDYMACVAVEGKDKDNGKTYKVIFNKATFNKNETLSPYYDIYVDGEKGKTQDFNNLLMRIWQNYNKIN